MVECINNGTNCRGSGHRQLKIKMTIEVVHHSACLSSSFRGIGQGFETWVQSQSGGISKPKVGF